MLFLQFVSTFKGFRRLVMKNKFFLHFSLLKGHKIYLLSVVIRLIFKRQSFILNLFYWLGTQYSLF